jgi:hypothetical protein
VRTERRPLRAWLLGAVLAALGAGACSSPQSFVVLSLHAKDPTPISEVTSVVVTVSQSNGSTVAHVVKTLTYPTAAPLQINQVQTVDLSVGFSSGQSGTVIFTVDAKDTRGCTIGHSDTPSQTQIFKGGTVKLDVTIAVANDCASADGGVAPSVDAFPGCDPVSPVCGANMTCQVNCDKKVGECTPGGGGGAGSVCRTNADCMPGTQCFDYTSTGCAVKLCLRFCNDDNGCQAGSGSDAGAPAANDAGGVSDGATDAPASEVATAASTAGNPPSACVGPVQCGGAATHYRTCSFSCDPRQTAVAARTSGCPTGLSCLVVGNMDQVDCACPDATLIGDEGADCAGASKCKPGLICNVMGATHQCRALCRCDARAGTCTAHQNDCPTGKSCAVLTNDTRFGVCL